MNSKAKSGKKLRRVIIATVTVVLIAVITVTGVLTDGFRNFGKAPDSGVTMEQPGGMVIGGTDGTDSGVQVMSAKIAKEDYAAYGVSPMAESSQLLTATVEPIEAMDKSVDWSIAFANPTSAWANGKTVTDYVTVTPTEDGALTATVECLQAFGEQIVVTCTSRNNPDVSAACTVDYEQKFEPVLKLDGEVAEDGAYIPVTVDVSGKTTNAVEFEFSTNSDTYTIPMSDGALDFSAATIDVTFCNEENSYTAFGLEGKFGNGAEQVTELLTEALRSHSFSSDSDSPVGEVSETIFISQAGLLLGGQLGAVSIVDNQSAFEAYFMMLSDTNKNYAAEENYAEMIGWNIVITIGDYVHTVHLYVDGAENNSDTATQLTLNEANIIF